MTPDEILKRVIYRDALILVLDKPSGIACHKGRGKSDENLEKYFEHLRFGLPRIPSLAHRLDKDTSGCLILGRHRKALADLGKMFQNNKVKKTYIAVVENSPPQSEGVIDLPLAKKSNDKASWQMKVDESGQRAVTEYKLLSKGDGYSWLELRPQTGRTHQLRVHCAEIGCPIIGDRIYGGINRDGRLLLHAQKLEIPLYKNREPVVIEAEIPEYMKAYSTGAEPEVVL